MWAEIHTSLASQVSVLAFGAAAVGLLMSAAAQLWMTASLVAGLLLLLATPAVCFLALAIYLGEQVRLMRAGFFLYRLEETANQAAGQPQAAVAPDDGHSVQILTWEHWASIHERTGDVDRHNRSAIILVFALLSALALRQLDFSECTPTYGSLRFGQYWCPWAVGHWHCSRRCGWRN